MRIDRGETLRYLGFRGQELSERDEAELARAEDICRAFARPATVMREFGLIGGTMRLDGTDVVLGGNAVRRHLEGCDRVWLVAATLGLAFDKKVAELMRTEPSVAVMTDAAGVAAIESVMDELCDAIAEKEHGGITRRFSCGYADFPLEQQKDFMRLLDMNRRLGVFIGADLLMTPQKTVTAVVGVRKQAVEM